MKITVELTGWLKKFIKGMSKIELEVAEGLSALDVLTFLCVPRAEIGFISVRNVKTDGDRLVDDDFIISDGDILKFYSPIIGG